MKLKIFFTTLLIILFSGNFYMKAQSSSKKETKILVVYYSRSSNTKEMAQQIKEETGADIFEIVPEKPYPSDYNECVEQAKKEIESNYKPALKAKLDNLDSYDVIFVGSPNWWSTIAPPVASFLSSYDFSGKTIIPFITHEGSRMGRSVSDIKKLCPQATLLDGLPVRGSAVKKSNDEILKWLQEIGIKK